MTTTPPPADPPPAGPVAAHVVYSGRVQGVGFRATAAWIARSRPITGWVKNLDDGRVELHAEGDRPEVEAFLNAVSLRFAGNIKAESLDWEPATGNFPSFEAIR